MSVVEIRNANGTIRYRIQTMGDIKVVLSPSGTLLGRIIEGKTYDAAGRLVSQGEDTGALVG